MKFFNSKKLFRFGIPIIAVLLITALLAPFQREINSTTIALAFLLVILFSATFFGRNPALLVSLMAMLCFNYFFCRPFERGQFPNRKILSRGLHSP
jgi:K+-sensing histidine kinase KdpD